MELLDDWGHHWNSVLAVIGKAGKFVNIASFGIHLPPKRVALALYEASEIGVKVRMVIGRHEPNRVDAVNSILCLQKKLADVHDMLPKVDLRVMNSHTKVVMNESHAIIGGRNLSFSNWPDLSFRFSKQGNHDTFTKLDKAFSDQFTKAQPVKEFLKVTRESLESQMEILIEQAIERRSQYA